MGNDGQRVKLYNAAKETWGEAVADAVMDVLPPWDHAEVVRKVDLENVKLALQAQIDGLRTELTAKIDGLYGRLVGLFLPLMFGVAALVLAAAKLG